jgi:hypothetical protein
MKNSNQQQFRGNVTMSGGFNAKLAPLFLEIFL